LAGREGVHLSGSRHEALAAETLNLTSEHGCDAT
jgi:hypothetical protein